ncbi:hypothetical protein C8R43DRAFT_1203385 [Mycena crocata]|nr:hypothetical protein C8R43DRAFT_1203385 [Mycena crocata]
MAELPQELIDAILEDVPDSSLGACSMTSCAFVVSSQRRLFRSMSLPDYRIYARAARLLAESPHLAGYVRYLALNISFIPDDYTHLKSILARLSDIERVAIIGTPSALMMRQLSLVDFLARLSIKCLALDAIHDVGASFLSGAFKYLEEVVLSNISIAVEVDEEEPSALLSTLSIASQEVQNMTQSMGQLHSPADAAIRHLSIHVDHFGHTLSFVLDPARISLLQQLTRLSIIFPPVSEDLWIGFTALLRACARTLNHLELELAPSPAAPVDGTAPMGLGRPRLLAGG